MSNSPLMVVLLSFAAAARCLSATRSGHARAASSSGFDPCRRAAIAYRTPMPVRMPSGTVTFLVTGVQDATRRWDEAPAEMAAAVRLHDGIVRAAIEGHGGFVFATGDDGFCAAFATVAKAAEAAVDAQRRLRAET